MKEERLVKRSQPSFFICFLDYAVVLLAERSFF